MESFVHPPVLFFLEKIAALLPVGFHLSGWFSFQRIDILTVSNEHKREKKKQPRWGIDFAELVVFYLLNNFPIVPRFPKRVKEQVYLAYNSLD